MATIKSRSAVKIVKRESEDRQGDFKFLESLIRYHILCVWADGWEQTHRPDDI